MCIYMWWPKAVYGLEKPGVFLKKMGLIGMGMEFMRVMANIGG